MPAIRQSAKTPNQLGGDGHTGFGFVLNIRIGKNYTSDSMLHRKLSLLVTSLSYMNAMRELAFHAL